MKESCVCCQAAAAKADGVTATLVLLFTLAGSIDVARIIEALCKRHGAKLDSMIFRNLIGTVRPFLRPVPAPQPLLRLDEPRTLRRKKRRRASKAA